MPPCVRIRKSRRIADSTFCVRSDPEMSYGTEIGGVTKCHTAGEDA